ncbi:hypothetical protein AXX16_3645 [Serratia rubidaea]|nr:hypothetical protein AXX16_3645 [Serratia rubidaea]
MRRRGDGQSEGIGAARENAAPVSFCKRQNLPALLAYVLTVVS